MPEIVAPQREQQFPSRGIDKYIFVCVMNRVNERSRRTLLNQRVCCSRGLHNAWRRTNVISVHLSHPSSRPSKLYVDSFLCCARKLFHRRRAGSNTCLEQRSNGSNRHIKTHNRDFAMIIEILKFQKLLFLTSAEQLHSARPLLSPDNACFHTTVSFFKRYWLNIFHQL